MKNSILTSLDHSYDSKVGLSIADAIGANAIIVLNSTSNILKTLEYKFRVLQIGTSYVPKYSDDLKENIKLNYEEKIVAKQIILRYSSSYRKMSSIQFTIENNVWFCVNLLKQYETKLLILPMIPHQSIEYFFYLAAQKLSVKVLYESWLPKLSGTVTNMFVSDEFNSLGSLFREKYKSNLEINPNIISENLMDYFKSYSISEPAKKTQNIYSGDRELENSLRSITTRFKKSFDEKGLYLTLLKTPKALTKFITNRFRYKLETHILKYINSISIFELPLDKNIIYFPLHYQPEATTIPAGGLFFDQLNLIKEIAANLGSEYILLVKEHPAYWRKPLNSILEKRSKKFYSEICNLNNVHFINSEISTYKIIESCFCVITITGTVTLEALRNGKYSINFGISPYRDLVNSINVKSVIELITALKDIEDMSFNAEDEFIRFLYCLNGIVKSYDCNVNGSLSTFRTDMIIDYINTHIK